MEWPFQINRSYHHRKDIHDVYQGQRQSGIVTPNGIPAMFVFTGHGGQGAGYEDKILPDGTLRYTGEGQIGDMQMIRGNKALRDHAQLRKDVLVFRVTGKGGPVIYMGQYYLSSWSAELQPDKLGNLRGAIIFDLVPAGALDETSEVDPPPSGQSPSDLEELRQRAYAAVGVTKAPGTAKRTVYERSRDVRDYVLARAGATCEGYEAPAPFKTAEGRPFLEPHHIRRLSDGGPDHPEHMVGICPNCHRRAHYGGDNVAFNMLLAVIAKAKEEDETSSAS